MEFLKNRKPRRGVDQIVPRKYNQNLKTFSLSADFAEVDILEEADKSDEDALKFNLDWMVKVIYTIKPSEQQ